MSPEVRRDRNAHALLLFREGRKYLHAVALHAPPVRLVKLPREELPRLQPLLYKGKPYPLARALRRFREAGRELGITDGAAAALRSIDNQRKGENREC